MYCSFVLPGILCQYAFTNNTHILFVVSNMFTILQFHFFFNFTSEMLHSGYANVHSALIHNNWYSTLFIRSHGNQCKQREFRRHSNYERVLSRNHSNEERSQSSRYYRDQDFLETPRCYGAKGYQEAPAASCFHSNTADLTNKDIASCSRCHSNTADVTNKDIVQLLSIMLTLTNMKSNQYLTFSRFHRIGFVNFVSCIKTAYSVFLILFKLS
uniref:Uncharacterized protein n=1 Tax=Cacopsylla melanoneura TaxID=428564 RepID=A0A8D8Z7T5_9HEMI